MLATMLFALQTVGAVAGPPAPVAQRRRVPAAPCPPAGAGDEVVVCAKDRDAYRLKPLPPLAEASAIRRAETRIGKARVGVEADDAGVGGFTSHRAMVKLRIPL